MDPVSVGVDVQVGVETVKLEEESLTGKEGKEMTIICVARGANPPADISWNVEELVSEVTSEEQENTIEDDDTYETISRVSFIPSVEDAGRTVFCEAKNDVMEDAL